MSNHKSSGPEDDKDVEAQEKIPGELSPDELQEGAEGADSDNQ